MLKMLASFQIKAHYQTSLKTLSHEKSILVFVLFLTVFVISGRAESDYTVQSFDPYPSACYQGGVVCRVVLAKVSDGGRVVIIIAKKKYPDVRDPECYNSFNCVMLSAFSVSQAGLVQITNWFPSDYSTPYQDDNIDVVGENFMIDHEGGNLYTYHENGSLDTFYKPTGVP